MNPCTSSGTEVLFLIKGQVRFLRHLRGVSLFCQLFLRRFQLPDDRGAFPAGGAFPFRELFRLGERIIPRRQLVLGGHPAVDAVIVFLLIFFGGLQVVLLNRRLFSGRQVCSRCLRRVFCSLTALGVIFLQEVCQAWRKLLFF